MAMIDDNKHTEMEIARTRVLVVVGHVVAGVQSYRFGVSGGDPGCTLKLIAGYRRCGGPRRQLGNAPDNRYLAWCGSNLCRDRATNQECSLSLNADTTGSRNLLPCQL